MRFAVLFILATSPAYAAELTCTFTQLCAPETGCQTNDGLAITFTITESGLTFETAEGPVPGDTIPDRADGIVTTLFPLNSTSTALLTLTQDGSAAFTEQRVDQAGRLQSLTFFGSCAPAA